MQRYSRLFGPSSIVDDGGSPPGLVALTDAYTAPGTATSSAWTDIDPAAVALALVLKTGGTDPASVDIEILWAFEEAATAGNDYFVEPVVNQVAGGVEELAPRESSWVGRAAAALPAGPPWFRRVYERPPEAMSYSVRLKRGSAVAVTAQALVTELGIEMG